MPMRSGTSPVAIPRAILSTISVCGMYERLIGLSVLAAFQAQTSWSTMPLLPPDRSHICMALSAVLWAQSAAGSGVGAAAAALSLGAAALGAVLGLVAWDADGAAPFDAGACEGLPWLHAAKRTIDANAR